MKKAAVMRFTLGLFAYLAAANAQTPSPPTPVTKYDGTYAFVSSTKVNETYTDTCSGRLETCGIVRRYSI